MVVICVNCGGEKFKAGQIELSERGGYIVVMPCSTCNTPNQVLHSDDMELCQMLLDFFGSPGPGSVAVEHRE